MLRTRADADELRKELVPGRHLAVVGAGFIGAEAAATALAAGVKVTIIEPIGAPMGRAMNMEVGGIFAEKYRREGAELRFGVSVENVERLLDMLQHLLDERDRVQPVHRQVLPELRLRYRLRNVCPEDPGRRADELRVGACYRSRPLHFFVRQAEPLSFDFIACLFRFPTLFPPFSFLAFSFCLAC